MIGSRTALVGNDMSLGDSYESIIHRSCIDISTDLKRLSHIFLQMPLIDDDTCEEAFPDSNDQVTVNMICAGHKEGGFDACQVKLYCCNEELFNRKTGYSNSNA